MSRPGEGEVTKTSPPIELQSSIDLCTMSLREELRVSLPSNKPFCGVHWGSAKSGAGLWPSSFVKAVGVEEVCNVTPLTPMAESVPSGCQGGACMLNVKDM